MGLLSELDYEVKTPNAFQRGMQRVVSTRPAGWVFQRTLFPLDKALYKATGGKVTVPGLMAGLPVIMVTTTGARSGEERTMPLLGIPMGDSLVIIGTNYGRERTPGWVYNLEKDPHATIGYNGRSIPVVSRLADEDETAEAFRRGAAVYGGYDKYRERIEGRVVRAFVLESDPAATDR
jgi:deazaflavin-dependent oxidoreductase (nitroreductase family)